MIQFMNYNFLFDGNSLDPYPTTVNQIDSVLLQNAEYDDFLVTKDINSPYSTQVPTEWDVYTILLANFDGNIEAGSMQNIFKDTDKIRIKRRKLGEYNWETIFEKDIVVPSDLSFSGIDYFGIQDEIYEYAWVPVAGDKEGAYITSEIKSHFNGVYICDAETIFKFVAGIEYGASKQVQLVGVYNPLGQKYPIYVSNGATNYETGSFNGKLIGRFEDTGIFDRKEMVAQKKQFMSWITNKKAKILKDWNGNMWCIFVIGEPQVTYDNQWGMGMMDVSFEYGEIGNPEDITDLQNVGLRPRIEE